MTGNPVAEIDSNSELLDFNVREVNHSRLNKKVENG